MRFGTGTGDGSVDRGSLGSNSVTTRGDTKQRVVEVIGSKVGGTLGQTLEKEIRSHLNYSLLT